MVISRLGRRRGAGPRPGPDRTLFDRFERPPKWTPTSRSPASRSAIRQVIEA